MNDPSRIPPADADSNPPATNQTRQQRTDLQATRNLLQATLDASLDMIQVFEAVRNDQSQIIDFIWVLNNHTAEKIYGDVIGKSLLQLNPGVVEAGIFDTFKTVVETGIPDQQERHYFHEQFNGWFYQSTVKLGDGVATTTTDITDRKKAELEILNLKDVVKQRVTSKYESIFNAIDEGLTIFDAIRDEIGTLIDLRYQSINRAMERQTGLDRQTIVGRLTSKVLPREDLARWLPMFTQVEASGKPVTFEEYVAMIDRWYLVSIYQDNRDEFASFYRDITERKRREQQQEFLLRLSDALRVPESAEETGALAMRMVAKQLRLDRCWVCRFSKEQGLAWLGPEYCLPDLPRMSGEYLLRDFPETMRQVETSSPAIDDVRNDPGLSELDRRSILGLGMGAYMTTILRRGEQGYFWAICASTSGPRSWTQSERQLLNDVTERVWTAIERARAEEALRESQRRFESIANLVPDLLWDSQLDGATNWYNQQWLEYTGQSFEEAIGWGWTEAIYPDDRDASVRRYQEAVAAGKPLRQEHRIRRHDGVYRWFVVSTAPLKDENGHVVKVYGAATDIHESKLAQDALQESEERLRLAIEATELATWEWHLDTNQVYWNEQHFRLFGMEPEPNPQSPETFLRHVHPQEQARIKGLLERAITERGVYDTEFCAVLEDGSTRWMSGYGRITEERDGQPIRMSGVMLDVDERRRAEDALRLADRRKDEFLAMLAHELRNPMSTIRSGLNILNLTSTEETTRSTVAMMSRQTEHLVRMVDDLLDVSRISRNKIALKTERVNLVELVQQAADGLQTLFAQSGKTLSVDLPPAPIYLEGDATRLTQVVTNLLTNGVRYTGEQGAVWLCLTHQNKEAIIQVGDNGIGLAADQLSAIFELFVQVDNSLARAKGGLGLGLTLVKRLVDMHGGRVNAQSQGIGQGSTFTVYLPTLTPAAEPTPLSSIAQATDSVIAQRILVIDDNADAALMMTMLLKLKGYETHSRNSGRAGIEAAERWQPAAILLDIGMPGLDGYATCRLLREQPWAQHIVVIALTGYGQEGDRQRTKEAGFDGHLVKPVELDTIAKLLTDLLDKKQN